MQLSIKILRILFWILLKLLVFFASPSVSESNFKDAVYCERGHANRKISWDVKRAMDNFYREINSTKFATPKIGSGGGGTSLYGLAQCYGDQTSKSCRECFQRSRPRVNECLPNSARIYLEGCFLRYDKYDFYSESTDRKYDEVQCGSQTTISNDAFMEREFMRKAAEVITNVSIEAWKSVGYAAMGDKGGVEGVYALAQCWQTIGNVACRRCLKYASLSLRRCLPAKEGRALYTGCYLKYSTERFYNVAIDVKVGEDEFRAGLVIVLILSLASLLLLGFFGARLAHMKLSKRKTENNNQIKVSMQHSKLNFKYEVLEKATESFGASRKLGQGGAGSVYKGILPDGHIVAVKRLFFNTRQWADEFFNEVNLIGGMQHKNLVKLLGCSIEGPESLLVYEYVPNRSLDQILFAKDIDQILSWKQRFDIILGIAEGLAYLHEGCDVKVIHRDIKTSNVLLDEHFVPKIADFGLARCLSSNRSHISTGIAGTLGYMAPEYLVRGQLTEKADIYAFGVMVLEIACGKKNSVFIRGSHSVLHSVWRHYKENDITQSVDSHLESKFPVKEASNVLMIGLLCTQALVSLRPSMSEVIQMLNDEDSEIPSPRQPPFLNSSVLHAADDMSRSHTMFSTTPKDETSSEASSFYTVDSTSFSNNQLNDQSKMKSLNQ